MLCLYKLLTKTLVNRLELILPKVVTSNQGNYVPGHRIIDNIVNIQEVLYSMKEKG